MARLTVADLLRHRVLLAPLEATALTLAIARELDRCRAEGRDASLPDDAAIVLHRDGEISFAADAAGSRVSDVAGLCALLARLLRVDDRECAGLLLHDGMTAVAFRAALARATPDDPSVLAAVYWRAASAARDRGHRRKKIDHREPARAERRQAQPPATELRRSIRRLERDLYDERQRAATLASTMTRSTAVRWAAVASLVALVVMSLLAWSAPPGPQIVAHVEQPRATAPERQLEPAIVRPPARTAPLRAARDATRRPGLGESSRPRGTEAPARGRERAVQPFVGGTRTIPWATR